MTTEPITNDELTTLEQIIAQAQQAQRSDWTDFKGPGASRPRSYIGYTIRKGNGEIDYVPLFAVHSNTKRASINLVVYAHNYIGRLVAEVRRLQKYIYDDGIADDQLNAHLIDAQKTIAWLDAELNKYKEGKQ
jgi:hypothetical protein